MNPNDEIRQQMLQYFYDRNSNATSKRGKRGSAVKISDARRELKQRHGLKQQEVISNLTYLIDNGWVNTIDIEKTYMARGSAIPQVTTFYEISAKGIDRIEGGSQFEPRDRYAGINITATGKNIITLGDGNIVNEHYSGLRAALEDLKQAITTTVELSDAEKLNLAVDIESIKDQLAKPEPNRTVIGQLWAGVKTIATLAGLADAYLKVEPYIRPLLSP